MVYADMHCLWFRQIPKGFTDLLQPGDLIYLTKENDQTRLDQIPLAQSSLISFNPKSGEVQSYVGGSVFNDSQFDRVRQSYPQSGSVFKPFIYASALSGGYNPSSLINDAPIIFEDENLDVEFHTRIFQYQCSIFGFYKNL